MKSAAGRVRLASGLEYHQENKKLYVGISSSWTHDTLSVVDASGAVLFAEENERVPTGGCLRHLPRGETFGLAKLLDLYCEQGSDIVIAAPLSPLSIEGPDRFLSFVTNDDESSSLPGTSPLNPLSPLAHLENLVERYLCDRCHAKKIYKRHYSRSLSDAAAACLVGPYEDAACAVFNGSDDDSVCYAYRGGMLFKINPIGSVARKSAGRASSEIDRGQVPMQGRANHARALEFKRECVIAPTDGEAHTGGLMAGRCSDVEDVAHAVQSTFEQELCEFLRNLYALVRSENLILTGECALNSLANGKLLRNTDFKNMYVPCTPYPPGRAIGAALLAYHEGNPKRRRTHSVVQTPYLGSAMPSRELPEKIQETGLYELQVCNGNVCVTAAKIVERGLIVAWIQGRAEFCPQSLGNRSVLADPRRPELSGRLKLLNAESVNTALPRLSVLHEYGTECLDHYETSPYMERAFQLRPKFARRVPGVTEKNGIVKIHTVRRDWNERLYDLISFFYRASGIPMIVNLDCGLPKRRSVKTAEDVLCILSTQDIDVVFVDDLMVSRKRHGMGADDLEPNIRWRDAEVMQRKFVVSYREPPSDSLA